MRVRRAWIISAVIVLLGAYLSSGVYFVRPNEAGVVRWFGQASAASRRVPPGLHYALPWPVCQVDRPTTTDVRRVYVGMLPDEREAIARGDMQTIIVSAASDMLSGDVNILKVSLVVQYQVSDPAAYLFGTAAPDALVRDTVQAMLIEALAGLPVDQALTAAKSRLQAETLSAAQDLLNRYGVGVQLVAANLQSIEPPRAVIAAFQEVVSAKKDGERAVDAATTEANRIVPRARGDAARIHEEAEGYRQMRIGRARGDAARFLSVLAEYRKSPEIFRQRLLLQTLETVLGRVRTYVLDHQPGDPRTNVRIVEPAPDTSQTTPGP